MVSVNNQMIKYYFKIFFLSLTAVKICTAQNSFSFKAVVYHNKLGLQKNITVFIDNKPAETNDAGVFVIGLPNGTNHVKVTLPTTKYVVLYPSAGYLLIPRDITEKPEIIIGNPKENDYLNQYLTLYKLIKKKPASISDPGVVELKNKMDSLKDQLLSLHYTETEIRTAKETEDGKEDYLPEITADIIDYRTKATDLKTAFKYVSDYAFDNANALQKLAEAITNYNDIFHKLDRQHINYEKRIKDFWQNDQLTTSFHNLMAFSLDTLHAQKIEPMQKVIAQIREYFVNGRSKNKALKKSIQDKISISIQEIDMLLPTLEKQTNELLNLLNG